MYLRNFILAAVVLTSAPAFADPGSCPGESDRAHLEALRDRIASAESPEAAREMALDQTRLGHKAIRHAARILPKDDGIAEAQGRLEDFDAGVAAATTQEEVADQFDALMQTSAVRGSCDYTNTEVVVIVVGFILGILPGILFLFLFC